LPVALFPPGTTHDCAIGQAGPSIWSRLPASHLHEVPMRLIGLAVVLALGLIPGPLVAEAQQKQVPRIGVLSGTSRVHADEEALRQGLRQNGHVEGQNLLIEWRYAEGKYERLPELATELVKLKVEVIVTAGTPATLAAKNATTLTPIVFTLVPDPVALEVVSSLARPGRNLSGFSHLAVEQTGKQLELLTEAVPSLNAIVIVTDRANPVAAVVLKEAQIAARTLGREARLIEVRDAAELEPAFTAIARERARGVVLVPSSFLVTHGPRIAELAIKRRLPVLAWTSTLTKSGTLISYGASTLDILRRAGGHVDKILKGAKPADLPVEQPTKFELVINLKTAKAIGLTIPQSVLLRADQLIE
jgi:putative tryptophan/tyrosine transport system substrate-binding protein